MVEQKVVRKTLLFEVIEETSIALTVCHSVRRCPQMETRHLSTPPVTVAGH